MPKAKDKKNKVVGFQVVEDECIWMKAGVVNFRVCDNAYDCYNCPFDRGMKKAMGLESKGDSAHAQPGWVEHLKRQYKGEKRPCRHALMGRIEAPKICTMNYECYHCPFDQMLDEMDFAQLHDHPQYKNVSGYQLAEGYYYHLGHTWARFEHGGRVRVGLDDFINRVLGSMKEIDLPPLGADLKQSEVGMAVKKDKNQAAVLSPVTGRILAVNHKATDHPEIVHEDPYQQGWLYIMEPDRPKMNLKGLYFGEESFRWIEEENKALLGLMGPEYERLAATGGRIMDDIHGNFPDIGWNRLVKNFLRTSETD
jgi:glycine cleavage system H lipoate-binding protein